LWEKHVKYTIQKNGFYGDLYIPTQNRYPSKALIILGGGGMPYSLTQKEAEGFLKMGISALSVGYFGVESAPKTIKSVPVEYIECAARFLHQTGYEKVIAVGISKGAELALVAGSLVEEINGVIALSPSSRVNMGIGLGISWVNESSWTYRGRQLPYAYAKVSGWRAFLKSIKARELTFRFAYEEAYRKASRESSIPVENIKGPVLVCGAKKDSLWPGAEACEEIIDRLKTNGFKYPYKMLVYCNASHILLPFETGYDRYFRVGRKYPEACRQTAYALKKEIDEWLEL